MREAFACTSDFTDKGVPSFRTVILYEDVATGVKAKHVADYVINNLGSAYSIAAALWNIALIKIGLLSSLVADQAAEADIVIISLQDGRGMTSSLRIWINQWITRRKGAHSALIMLFEETNPATDFAKRHLQNAARRAGMDFFAQIGKVGESEIQPDCLSLAV